jgi:hypothetical protein
MSGKEQNLVVIDDDGFSDENDGDRLLQGGRLTCVDGAWKYARDDTEVAADKRFLALGTAEGQQHWEDEQLVEEIKKKPGMPFALSIDERNAKIPQDTWEEGLNGPRAPWTHVFAVYLLDPVDGAIYTSINSTKGQARAVRELKSKVRWMRSLRGEKLMPVVVLGRQVISKQYKKFGPDFVVVDWRDLGPKLPASSTPLLENPVGQKEQHGDPIEQIGRPRAPVDMKAAMRDELPAWNDNPADPIDILDAPASVDQQKEVASAKQPSTIEKRKPAATSTPQVNKRGVQKIAGGRRR